MAKTEINTDPRTIQVLQEIQDSRPGILQAAFPDVLKCAKGCGTERHQKDLPFDKRLQAWTCTNCRQGNDPVNHPSHYTFAPGYEVIDVLEAWKPPPHIWTAIKYLARFDKKGRPKEDLKKAIWYIERYIEKCL